MTPGGTRLLYERMGGLATGITAVTSSGASAGSERLLHDGLDSVVGRVSGTGTAVSYRYDAWGGFRGAGPGSGEPSLAYAGQHWDEYLGLSYAQQRWYEPRMGRFLSEDPLFGDPGMPASLHAWGYANGNPLTYTDPLGTTGESNLRADREFWAKKRKESSAARDALSQRCTSGDQQSCSNLEEYGATPGFMKPFLYPMFGLTALALAVPVGTAAGPTVVTTLGGAGGGAVVLEGAVDTAGVVVGAHGCLVLKDPARAST